MLDKSIPYKSLIMAISPEKLQTIQPPALPDGFRYHFFTPGDENHWARIEASVLEFTTEEKALHYFQNAFLPEQDELEKRCVFVVAPNGIPVATAMAWFERETDPCGHRPVLHWVSCTPKCQGRGLGRAAVCRALSLFPMLHPGAEAFLHTQTWSHVAVWMYYSLGFRLCRQRSVVSRSGGKARLHENEFREGVEVLRQVLGKEQVDEMAAQAVD